MQILRSMGTVSGFTLGSRVFGFLRDMFIARVLGSGAIADALVVSMKLPSVFRRLLAEGALTAAFIPIFTRLHMQEGERKAQEFAEEVLSFLTGFMILFTIVVEFFIPEIVPFIAPGLSSTPERLTYAIQFMRITFPFLSFLSLCALYSGILNSFERFAVVASSPLIGNLFVIVFVLAFSPMVEQKGHLFAAAILASGAIQFIWVAAPVHNSHFRLRLRWPQLTAHVKKLLKLMGPVALSSGMHQFNVLIGVVISSLLPVGGISFLYYAERINQLPTSTIGTALATVMLPLLARQIRAYKLKEANEIQNNALEFALLLTFPAMISLVCLAEPIIVTLFKSGAFSMRDAQETSYALIAFTLGLPAYVLTKLFSAVFYAHENTKTPLIFAVISVLLDIVLALVLLKPYQHVGIAVATATAAWFYTLGLGVMLYRRSYFSPTQRLMTMIPRLLVTNVAFGIALFYLREFAQPYFAMYKTQQVIALTIVVIAGLAIYVTIGYLLGAINFDYLKKQLTKEA